MSQVTTLAAEVREGKGKGTAHAIRRQDRIPAVVYGDKQAPLMISMAVKEISRYANSPSFLTSLLDLTIGGKKHRVLPRDVQFDPVSDKPIHADFLRVSASTVVRVAVPVSFMNPDKAPGIKRGGTLNVVHHEIEVTCAPHLIPEKFEIDLEGLQIGDAVHLSAIKLPSGVKLTTLEKDFTIATIAVPSGVRAEAEEAAAAAASAATADAAATAPAAGAAAPAAAGAKAAPAAAKAADKGKK
ncbi:MAG: 50S ribosomal protein L25/general stress protein Ctc [Alphaproteobacteria bacterium]|nr:50S ribosomal protein L25/general stress protein Ctc [Alphaproteobacteria bacterium]